MKMRLVWVGVVSLVAGCEGPTGKAGDEGKPCSVTQLDGGGARILCADGTTAVVPGGTQGAQGAPGNPGAAGDAGSSCTVVDLAGGAKQIQCTDGTSVTVSNGTNGTNGTNGNNGTNGANGTGGKPLITDFHGSDHLAADLLSKSGKFIAGITITGARADSTGTVSLDFRVTQTLSDGGVVPATTIPQPKFTVAKLVPAVTGEAGNHWVPYITRTATVPADAGGYPNPPGTVVLQGYRENNGTFTNDGGGGYSYVYHTNLATAAWATDGGLVGYDQTLTHRVAILLGGSAGATGSAHFDFVPNGAAISETRDIIDTDTSCRQCHGAGFAAHGGDRTEVGVCVTCHNPTSTDAYTNNTVDFRVLIHKIHAGSELASVPGPDGVVWDDPATAADESADNHPFSIGPTVQNWWKIEFPAVLSNCTKCHNGPQANVDNWKTVASTQACTSCHDDVDTRSGTNHAGGAQPNDAVCSGCHPSSGAVNGLIHPVAISHDWTANDPRLQAEFTTNVTMTPPANGQFYVAGEAPQLHIVISDADSGTPLDHTTLLAEASATAEGCVLDGGADPCPPRDGLFTSSALLVHGPRANQQPVLTSAARARVVAANNGPWNLADAGSNFKLQVDNGQTVPSTDVSGGDISLAAVMNLSIPSNPSDGGTAIWVDKTAATPAEVIAWLNSNATFKPRAIAYTDELTGRMAIRSRNKGYLHAVQLQASNLTTLAFNNDLTVHNVSGSTPVNPLAKLADGGVNDPLATYAPGSITYQLDPVDDLAPGTYTIGFELADRGRISVTNFKVPSVAFYNFQVGQAANEPPIAANCNMCHQNNAGAGMLFDPSRHNKILRDGATDQCTGCHDYQPAAATGGWSGAYPIARRVHAVHNGSALKYPNTTVAHADEIPGRNWDIEFPQDIRNCESCHKKGTTSGTWATKPNRIACGGCHDSDAAAAHIKIMTYDPTPNDAYSGDEVEACNVCHTQ